ncbi:MAG: hypothetical protein AAF989_05745, partial [Planctomycetota bacterium]
MMNDIQSDPRFVVQTATPWRRSFFARAAVLLIALISIVSSTGCQLHFNAWDGESIPANRLDPSLFSCSRESLKPIPQVKLGQVPPQEHLIGAGDVLSVYIYGVFPP